MLYMYSWVQLLSLFDFRINFNTIYEMISLQEGDHAYD